MKKFRTPSAIRDLTEVDYLNKLTPQEREFLERFNFDYYSGGVYEKDPNKKDANGNKLPSDKILIDNNYNDIKIEAIRNHNSLSRDALNVAIQSGTLSNLDEETVQFMEEACDEWDYQRVYQQQGFKAAVETVYEQTRRDLTNTLLDVNVTLTRFYFKINKIRLMNKRDRTKKETK